MILIFVASLNENVKLAKTLKEQLESLEKKSVIINLVDLSLPMYDSSKEEKDGIPQKVNSLIEQMNQAQGYVFVAPEYNFLPPPVLLNTIAWVSRAGNDFRELFTLKPIQLATSSGSGGNDVSNAMRTQFTKLGAIILPRDIVVTYQKPLNKESSQRILKQFIELTNTLEKRL